MIGMMCSQRVAPGLDGASERSGFGTSLSFVLVEPKLFLVLRGRRYVFGAAEGAPPGQSRVASALITARQKAGRSSGQRLGMRPRSTTTMLSSQRAPAFTRSSLRLIQLV